MPDYKVNESTIIRVQKNEFPEGSGKYYLDIRRFYWESERNPGWYPTRKGISIPFDIAPKILKIMEDLLKEDSTPPQ